MGFFRGSSCTWTIRIGGFCSNRLRIDTSTRRGQFLFRGRLVEEVVGHLGEAGRKRSAVEVTEFGAEAVERHDGLGHGAMTAGRSEVREPSLHELSGVARVAEVADADDQRGPDD